MKAKMNPFDPWTATWEEAERLGGDGGGCDPWQHNPVFQKQAAVRVLSREKAVQAGDGGALLACVRDCLEYGLSVPGWVTAAFIACHDRVAGLHVSSWDEAFGPPFPKSTNVAAAKKRRELSVVVYLDVEDLRRKRRGARALRGEDVFERVGEKHGISGGAAKRLHESIRRLMARKDKPRSK
ncbi:MAG TPA: hypothetical protein PLP29_09185 [Candidatus Ozemobacteraceae bacterium]|nr:hypothetical protein [Candidatus Ozemobacteraceae bacterium]